MTPAPAITRMGRLLAVMSEHSDEWWTLADLARESGVSKASAHSLLLALVDEGFVRRCDDPVSYALGPALVELGERARASVDLAGTARPYLDRLSEATGCTAMVGAVRGPDLVVVAASSVPHPFGLTVPPGHRTVYAAPTGTVYAAWAEPRQVADWLDRAEPAPSARRRRELLASIDLVRSRGWSVTVRDGRRGSAGTREALDADLENPQVEVLGIGAPVIGASGQVECSLAVVDLPPRLGARRLRTTGAEVAAVAGELGAALRSMSSAASPSASTGPTSRT